ncbi:glycoside hydrolase family 43 protein [Gorillibacterium sp. sgz5001074]|uniref:glycoside hydrolase family 43 protein n=1 Tax=Gorillibacterium sp. sgz5001074 TaxID=3446695 RepID=UPI003F663946
MKYRNPVLPGYYPDPSVIRVGLDYYMVTSTFEYFPGVPVFHSRDLVTWRQIGHVLTRRSQVDLLSRKSSAGIYAPTIRHHNGTFYMITTDVRGIGNFYVTASDPAGPWSDPVPVPHGNIDPSLFFDDDGKVYVTTQMGEGLDSHIIQYEIDIKTGEARSEPVAIFHGDGGVWCEGPHLYKIHGVYYLIAASGGTGKDHREIVGRSTSPYGPFEPMSRPMLTHNGLPEHPFQNLGHAELVEDHRGGWWAFFLGTRPVEGRYSVLGRETFLAPVTWTEDGWPMVDSNEGTVGALMEAEELPERLPPGYDADAPSVHRTVFSPDQELGPEWCYVRREPEAGAVSLAARPGWLALAGGRDTLSAGAGHAAHYLCRRQQHRRARLETAMDFRPLQAGDRAGLAVRISDRTHYTLTLGQAEEPGGGLAVTVASSVRGEVRTEAVAPVSPGSDGAPLRLAIRADAEVYEFLCSGDGETWTRLCALPACHLSSEYDSGFTGVTLGLYAVSPGSGSERATAYYRYAEYLGANED